MLDSNSAFFRAITKLGFETNSYTTAISIFSGDQPTEEYIESYVSPTQYDISSIIANLDPSSVLLGNIGFETQITSEYEGDDDFVIPLSDSLNEITVKASGTATWFLMYAIVKNVATDVSQTASLFSFQVILGTVGDLGSGADLELPESSLDINKDYKCSDIKISLI